MKRLQIIICFLCFFEGFSQPIDSSSFQWIIPDAENPFNKYLSRDYTLELKKIDGALFSGKDTVRFKNEGEKIMAILTFSDGIIQNITAYYDNGAKYEEANFKKGLPEGYNDKWYKTGELEWRSLFINGKVEGPMLFWYKNGNLSTCFSGKDGDCPFITRTWYENGQLHTESLRERCCDSSDVVHERVWYDTGELMSDMYLRDKGKQHHIEYCKNGKIGREGYYIDMRGLFLVGKWTEWYENGQKKWEIFYNDGNTREEANYKIGTWSWWDEKGNLIKQEIYKDNVLVDTKEFLPKTKKEN